MTIVVEKGGGRFWEGSTYSFLEKRGYILGGRGRFWEWILGGIFWEGGVNSWRVVYNYSC